MKPEHHFKIASTIAHALDTKFSVFGFKFGFDPLLNLIPGLGDVIAAILAFYIVYVAKLYKVPQKHINQMIANIALDFIMGLIPIVGTVGDFFFKANTKNLEILRPFVKGNVVEGELLDDRNL